MHQPTHASSAEIASGMADVGIGVQTVAQRFGLGFVPLPRERYFVGAVSGAILWLAGASGQALQ